MTEHQHSLPSPALVQHHLHGMHYPASRDDLINYARGQCEGGDHPNDECERVVQVLSELPDREYQRPTDVNKAFGELARNYLERASYPARRDDLVASARDQGADDVVLDTIIMIPSQEYRNPDAVIVEIETAAVLGATLTSPMRTIVLPSGDRFPVLGQGTWHLAEAQLAGIPRSPPVLRDIAARRYRVPGSGRPGLGAAPRRRLRDPAVIQTRARRRGPRDPRRPPGSG